MHTSPENEYVITVAIADDHALFRAGVKTALAKKKDVSLIAEADNGLQLIHLLQEVEVDIIILDIQMPIMDGIQTLPVIREMRPKTRVIILSMHNDHSMISKLMEMGANSYLTKNSDSETIYQAIKTCYYHEFFFNELTNKALLRGLRTKRSEVGLPEDVNLTEKELTVLKLMCDEKTTKEIADIVDISPRTVEAIRDKLKEKTGAKSMAGLVMYAVKNGIIHEEGFEPQPKKKELSREQIIHLFSLSTSILAYVIHDLADQNTILRNCLKDIAAALRSIRSSKAANELNDLLEKAQLSELSIGSIINLINSHFTWSPQQVTSEYAVHFICKPSEIIKIVQQRYPQIKFIIDDKSPDSLQMIYPASILLAIFSELAENTRKYTTNIPEVLIEWKVVHNCAHFHFHDNGPGFPSLEPGRFLPRGLLQPFAQGNVKGMGLGIIERTLIDSNGTLLFTRSHRLNGALVYFEMPLIDYCPKKPSEQVHEFNILSNEQIIKLFKLSTSILAYINHDLAGQRNLIAYALEEAEKVITSVHKDTAIRIKQASGAITAISSIVELIRSHAFWRSQSDPFDLTKIFLTRPAETIDILKERYKEVSFEIISPSQPVEIIYPPQIFYAILSELVKNAQKLIPSDPKILIQWNFDQESFQCYIHDNGPGFKDIGNTESLPLETFLSDESLSPMGLKIINRTISDSGGNIFISRSKELGGALLFFVIPILRDR